MYVRTLESCAIAEIDQLRNYSNSEAAMLAFCKQVFEDGVWFRDNKTDRAQAGALISFYVFSAPEGVKYGSGFAELIEQEGFGAVWASPKRLNKAYHPDHSNQMWVWSPERDRLLAWYEAKRPKVEVKKKKIGPRI